VYVAGLNDSITEGFRDAIKVITLKGWTIKKRISLFFRWLRSWRLGAIEKRLLTPFDLILVQSKKDQQVLDRISNGSLDRVMILSNGVDKRLFSISQDGEKNNILFVGSLKGYSPLVELIVTDVWPSVKELYPDATFTIVGRGATKSLLNCVSNKEGIEYIPFVRDIEDIYRNRTLAILPVRKSSGLINKVVESMAAGIPVVGDEGSFNALPGFQDGVHGIVANDVETMKIAVLKLLGHKATRLKIASSANRLIHEYFSWDDRISAIQESLYKLKQGPGVIGNIREDDTAISSLD
jgi:glycosyltransferase involved in cell wall biosynthesis